MTTEELVLRLHRAVIAAMEAVTGGGFTVEQMQNLRADARALARQTDQKIGEMGHLVFGDMGVTARSPQKVEIKLGQEWTDVTEHVKPDPTAHLPGMFEDARAYCVARYDYEQRAYVSAVAREQHIEADARSTATDRDFAMPWNAGYARGVSEGRRQAIAALDAHEQILGHMAFEGCEECAGKLGEAPEPVGIHCPAVKRWRAVIAAAREPLIEKDGTNG
jgi:hypothetical protein